MNSLFAYAIGDYQMSAEIGPALPSGFAISNVSICWLTDGRPVIAAHIDNYFWGARFNSIDDAKQAIRERAKDLNDGRYRTGEEN